MNFWSAPGLLASNRLMWIFFSLSQAVLVGLALAKGKLQPRASIVALFGLGLCGAIYAATRGRRLHRPLGVVSNAGFLAFAALGVWKDRAAIPALEMGLIVVSVSVLICAPMVMLAMGVPSDLDSSAAHEPGGSA